ncbi:hypothetical protein [Cryobacterium psychrophilum]|uniref:Uncharacterized protein n=1 Tax=Cryobacterium psychrophilum TaxID=41988 RepID=A0A4Y8KQW6_9MICO|nr:hypothetical protein [Cryobacterium psychrophilum]TFD81653.1 hypothetical protein E3T53_01195 [Cryobacterium psychrophilum]
MLQDWSKGRRSEVGQINSLVRNILERNGKTAPVSTAPVGIAHRIEAGSCEPSLDLLCPRVELSRA